MHKSVRISEALFFVAMAVATSGCVPALKVSAVGASATSVSVQGPGIVSPTSTKALPPVHEIVIVRGGSQGHGLSALPQQQHSPLAGIPAVFPPDKLDWPPNTQQFRIEQIEEQPVLIKRSRQWEVMRNAPDQWKRQFPHLNLNDSRRTFIVSTPPVPIGDKLNDEKKVARVVAFFNERIRWWKKPDPYQFATRPGNWHLRIPQPDVAIYFVHDGRVVDSRGLKGYELWAGASNDSLYRVLTIDEIRELEELGIHHKVK